MADTAYTTVTEDSPASRQIRVFLSSTFRDFMEERDLLVKQVFPSQRRRAQERGVEVVDVDLRWGVTQEESEQGKVIGICLAEIERCRPYFIGMLGERYGWTPGKTDYPDELFEKEQLAWIRDHQGDVSVTELEILHGVLNDQEMAGRAFFYFRDPAWSSGQSEPGFVCDTPEEKEKLAGLKRRILASGFPVKQGLPDPKAIADQIEADLWALIEAQYPDLDTADALEKEARKHASYRKSRLGAYLGQHYVDQLEALISANEQKILITGESGSGKSALIANWMHQHELAHPGDAVYAHHLGSSNDANAIRPLLGRLLDTASKLLKEADLITEPIQVPEDWWALSAKVAETFQDLGHWCRKTGHRWIWVLDGLDRLAEEDQLALPWLPLLIPEGVSVMISALECEVSSILQERGYQPMEIGPLKQKEQVQLIESYLERYTKKLDADRLQQILACDLARSPLFLRVLLEELRQCGRFETLEAQITEYIRPNADSSLAVNDLYARVLARLESDCGHEPVQKALTALWASRAGLSEPELLAITGLTPLQWAPIDLALEKAFGRNGNRIVFDHQYLHKAVEKRYRLSSPTNRNHAHKSLYRYFSRQNHRDPLVAKEIIFQATKCSRDKSIRDDVLKASNLASLANGGNPGPLWEFWLRCRKNDNKRLDMIIATEVRDTIQKINALGKESELYDFCLGIAKLLYYGDCCGDLLVELSDRLKSLAVERGDEFKDIYALIRDGSHVRRKIGMYSEAINGYLEIIDLARAQSPGDEVDWMTSIACESIAWCHISLTSYDQALEWIDKAIDILPKNTSLGKDSRLVSLLRYRGQLLHWLGDEEKGATCQRHALEMAALLFGRNTAVYLNTLNDYVVSIAHSTLTADVVTLTRELEDLATALLPASDPRTWRIASNCYSIYLDQATKNNDQHKVEDLCPKIKKIVDCQSAFHGKSHEHTIQSLRTLARAYHELGEDAKAFGWIASALKGLSPLTSGLVMHRVKCIIDMSWILNSREKNHWALRFLNSVSEVEVSLLQPRHRVEFKHRRAEALFALGRTEEGSSTFREALEECEEIMGKYHRATMDIAYCFAEVLSEHNCRHEAILLRRRELTWCQQQKGLTDPDTLHSLNQLAIDLREIGQLKDAETLFRQLVVSRQEVLEPSDLDISRSLSGLAKTLEKSGKLEEAATFAQQTLDHLLEHEGHNSWYTNHARLDLARLLHKIGQSTAAINLIDQLDKAIESFDGPEEVAKSMQDECTILRDKIVLGND